MEHTIIFKESDYIHSEYNTKEWEQSVIILRWEHDYESKTYTIKYEDKI